MNIKTFTLLSCILSISLLHADNDPHRATRKLWNGIVSSNVRMVQQALHEGADPSLRAGVYEDTALMTALRIYGKTLANPQKHALRNRIIAYSSALVLGYLIGKYTEEKTFFDFIKIPDTTITILLPTILVGTSDIIGNLLIKITPASTKIVMLLIEADQNIYLRNKEGLTALDILRSYFPLAYQRHDQNWHTLFQLLHNKGTSS